MRSRIIFYLFLIVVLVGAVFAYQYWNFRVPYQSVNEGYDHTLRETDGVKHTVALSDIVSGGVPRDNIPSIDEPQFESVGAADIYLKDNGDGLDVEINGRHRFYPYQLLVWHEIVNDNFAGKPIAVTYCPLCESGIVFGRNIDGRVVEFGTSGRLWNNNLVMYDRTTQTLWSQILGRGVVGELAGLTLSKIPARVMKWNEWKKAYPDGEVLTRDTGVERDYTRDPYGNYYENADIKFPLTSHDARLRVKESIVGLVGDQGNAYLRAAVPEEGVVNDQLDGQPVLLIHDQQTGSLRAFLREVKGQILTFSKNSGEITDEQTQSQWTSDGFAGSGEWQGVQLAELPLIPAFWFCWAAAYPNTNLHLP